MSKAVRFILSSLFTLISVLWICNFVPLLWMSSALAAFLYAIGFIIREQPLFADLYRTCKNKAALSMKDPIVHHFSDVVITNAFLIIAILFM